MDLHNFGAGVGLDLLSQPFENVRENLFQDICSRALLQVPKGKRMPNFYDLVTKARKEICQELGMQLEHARRSDRNASKPTCSTTR